MKRHSLDVVSLVAAVIFLGVFGIWLGVDRGSLSIGDIGWLTPSLLIVAGLAGVAASLRRR
ncbi:MAG TPA: hypothetical protein VKB55_01905 [Nocardioidaceae bacterium]|jgi:hypothetical protein|nr:hypothetical protein [Nocardioidaceae bacterium]